MRESALSQQQRLFLLIFELAILCIASCLAFGHVFPGNDDKGLWFNTALLCLIFGVRLDTPFFATPADVILYTAPAILTLLQGNSWGTSNNLGKAVYSVALVTSFVAAAAGMVAILTKDSKQSKLLWCSNFARAISETIGRPRFIYSIVILYALYAFHRQSPKELGLISTAWFLIVVGGVEEFWKCSKRLWYLVKLVPSLTVNGQVVAYQTPNIILIRQSKDSILNPDDTVAIADPLGKSRFALVLDSVGRDDGVLVRAIELADANPNVEIGKRISALSPNSVARIDSSDSCVSQTKFVKKKASLVGIVAPDTSVERLFFEVVKNEGLEEGRLVEVEIGGRVVTYQLVNGLTKEEVVQQKNTYGFARAQAQKIGEWDSSSVRFRFAKWLPIPNAPIFLKSVTEYETKIEAIGHFPKSDYGVTLHRRNGEEVGLAALVTHNTAILGILGVGKSSLAMELVERMMAQRIKVVCIDLTNQYAKELAPYYDEARETESLKRLQEIGKIGKKNVTKNVEEGGSKSAFAKAVKDDLEQFLAEETFALLKVYNPAHFEVWKQDSKPYGETASMASLTPAEITHLISDAVIKIVENLGMTDKARVCIVYEEAHTLVPEWNSAVAEGDKAAANGTARAILQGRKYGLGCLLITQRTANVTKTILNQCNTVFAMRTFDETGKDFLSNYLGREYADMLPNLEERHAVFFGRASSCENPVLIRVNDRTDFLTAFRSAYPPPPLTEIKSESSSTPKNNVPF